MPDDNVLLPLLLALPMVGALVCALAPEKAARAIALTASLGTAAVAGALAWQFDWSAVAGSIRYIDTNHFVLADMNFGFRIAVDSVSLWLVLLTVLLMPLAIASSFQSITDRQAQYYAWMLVLLAAMIGVFVARDALLFYIFFELTLIPMYFIIGIWGGPQRRYAAAKFFLFTFAGSIFTLAAIVYLGVKYDGFALDGLVRLAQMGSPNGIMHPLNATERFWIVLGLSIGFAVKVPLFPLHTWLPLAHTEAPTAGSVILAGVLLKLGTYGLYKIVIPIGLLDPSGVIYAGPSQILGILAVIGVIYGALAAWVQQDIKKLVAYSSVSHLGFCVLGLMALNDVGVQGSVLYMINHGLSTGALFLVVGMVYDRFHTRDINELSGLARRMPRLAFFFVLFALSSIGLPGLNGFVSEFLTILGAFTSPLLGIGYGAIAALGVILGAVYMLHMVARVIFGPLKIPGGDGAHESHPADTASHGAALGVDLGVRETVVLLPLAVLVVVLGVYPNVVLDSIAGPVHQDVVRSVPEGRPTMSAAPIPQTGRTGAAVQIEASHDSPSRR
jgi:NADH-quinone oxidoreductase subunit M